MDIEEKRKHFRGAGLNPDDYDLSIEPIKLYEGDKYPYMAVTWSGHEDGRLVWHALEIRKRPAAPAVCHNCNGTRLVEGALGVGIQWPCRECA